MQNEATDPSRIERRWAAVSHISGSISVLLSMGLLGFLAPLVIWIAKRGDGAFIATQSREALNFQLTLLALHVAGWLFVIFTLGIGYIVALPAFALLWVAELVLGFVAAVRVMEGEAYRYPLTLRLL